MSGSILKASPFRNTGQLDTERRCGLRENDMRNYKIIVQKE